MKGRGDETEENVVVCVISERVRFNSVSSSENTLHGLPFSASLSLLTGLVCIGLFFFISISPWF